MNGTSSVATRGGRTPTVAERANAILLEEIAGGALANVAAARRAWSAPRRDVLLPDLTRRFAADVGGLLETVLELMAPRPLTGSWAPPSAGPNSAPTGGRRDGEAVPVLRARRPAGPGGAAEIRTSVENDGPSPVEVGFLWSDLVADSDGRIPAGFLRLAPGRVRVAPGTAVVLTIGLDVPRGARPGVYRGLLQATEPVGLRAVLTFPVAADGDQEDRHAM